MKLIVILIALFSSVLVFAQEEMYDICPIKNSQNVPDAIVYNLDGKEINLNEYIGERPAVVVFYRGAWCPYCIRHLSALQEVKPEMDKLGYELIAITPDSYSRLDSSIVRGENLDFQLFSDKDINAINAFGIGWKINDELYLKYKNQYNLDTEWWTEEDHHVLPVPSIFIINKGKVKYQHVDPNYSERLSPKILLGFLEPN